MAKNYQNINSIKSGPRSSRMNKRKKKYRWIHTPERRAEREIPFFFSIFTLWKCIQNYGTGHIYIHIKIQV